MPTKSRTAKALKIAKYLIPVAIVALLLCWLLYSEYEFVQLGSLGGTSGGAMGLNNRGQVVGWSETADGHTHAFLWDAANGMRDLGTLGGPKSHAWNINEKGQVVGASETGDGSTHAFLWQRDAGMKDLHAAQAPRSIGADINDRGQIVGCVESIGSSQRTSYAFYWDQASGMVMIPVPSGSNSYGFGINNAGQVVGNLLDSNGDWSTPFIWDRAAGLKQLHFPRASCYAGRINNAGAIIGKLIERERLFSRPRRFAFLRKPSGRIVYLKRFAPAGADDIDACAINDNGWIAGATEYKSRHRDQQPILLRPRRLLRRPSNSPH